MSWSDKLVDISAAPDGAPWQLESDGTAIYTANSGTAMSVALPNGSGAKAVATGGSGKVWFVNNNGTVSRYAGKR